MLGRPRSASRGRAARRAGSSADFLAHPPALRDGLAQAVRPRAQVRARRHAPLERLGRRGRATRSSSGKRARWGPARRASPGPPVDFVVDPALSRDVHPVHARPAPGSPSGSLMLPELEIKTIVLEDRGDRGRYAAIPGGGVTLIMDELGRLPEARAAGSRGPRSIVRAGAESRPAAAAGPRDADRPQPRRRRPASGSR